MIAQRMSIRAGPRWRDRLIPLPRGDTGEPSEGRKGNQETLRKATGMGPPGWSVSVLGCGMGRGGPPMRPPILRKAPGIGPPVRFGRARESIAKAFIEGVSWRKVTFDRGRGIGPPETVSRTVSSTTGTGPPASVKATFIEGAPWKKVTVDRGRLQREECVESL
jgi:hypothetical protein